MTGMDIPALHEFLASDFPQVAGEVRIERLSEDSIAMRLRSAERHLRPGGTMGGPAMFLLADVAAYCLILSRIGRRPLAVTVNAAMDFMRKPAAARDLICEASLLKLGRTLAVVEGRLFSEGATGVVARANVTYAIPPADRTPGVSRYPIL